MKFSWAAYVLHMAWSLPLSIAIALSLLYREIGSAAFTGVFLFVLTSPLSGIVMKRQFKFQKKTVEARDVRGLDPGGAPASIAIPVAPR